MKKHTKGPWQVDPVEADDKTLVYMRVRPKSGRSVAFAGIYEGHDAEANARLIAAAPELLEACRDAAIRLEMSDATDNPTYRRLEAAIAKAEISDG